MEQPSSPARRWPWGVVLNTVVLAVLVVSTYRPQNPTEGLAVVSSATLAGAAAFVAGRRLLGTLWGLILALTLVLHPLYSRSGLPANALGAEALKLITLAGLVTAWRYAFSSRLRVGKLLTIGLVLALAGGLAWLTAPVDEGSPAGLVVFVLDLVGLALAAGLARERRVPSTAKPVTLNLVSAVLLAVLLPAAGIALAWPLAGGIAWLKDQGQVGVPRLFPARVDDVSQLTTLLQNTIQPPRGQTGLVGLAEKRADWAWPLFWVAIPLMLFGLARTVWRGAVQRARGQPPLPWTLTLFTLTTVVVCLLFPFYTNNDLLCLPLATLAILLSVFGVGDWVFGVGEKIRLAPPGEEPSSATE